MTICQNPDFLPAGNTCCDWKPVSVRGPDFWLIRATYKRWNFRTLRKIPATVLDVSHNPIPFSQLSAVGISLTLWKTDTNAQGVGRPDQVYKAKRFGIQTETCPATMWLTIYKINENKPKDIIKKSIAIFLKNSWLVSSINFVHTLFHIREIPNYLNQRSQISNTNKVAELNRTMGNRLW